MVVVDELRQVWDSDLDATEIRFQALLDSTTDQNRRAEILTQLARVQGLRGEFAAGHELVDQAQTMSDPDSIARVRILLERGRLDRSAGKPADARPMFISAYELARNLGDDNLAADAAHMVGLVDDIEEWTERGMAIAERSSDPQVRRWMGPLLNNLGWHLYETGDYVRALEAFEQALAARQAFPDEAVEIEIARYTVAKTLRALGKPARAAQLMEQAIAASPPDGWFHEELAEDYAASGRFSEAAGHARRALDLLEDPEPAQSERLREIASFR